jgi:hypothetical protein
MTSYADSFPSLIAHRNFVTRGTISPEQPPTETTGDRERVDMQVEHFTMARGVFEFIFSLT